MASQPSTQQSGSARRLSASTWRERVRAHFPRRRREPPRDRPIYIYPGLLRTSPERAVVLDSLCPAAPFSETVSEKATDDRQVSNNHSLVKSGTLGEVCCPICFDDFIATDLVRTLYCGHQYHSGCLLTWLTKGASAARCPLCQASLSLPYECCMGTSTIGDGNVSGSSQVSACSEYKEIMSSHTFSASGDGDEKKSTPVVRLPSFDSCYYQTICASQTERDLNDSAPRTYCYLQHDYTRFSRRN